MYEPTEPVRMGIFLICLLNMIIAFIAIFSSAFRGWWVFWIKFGLSCVFGLVGFYSVYKIDRTLIKVYLWWIIFDLCVDIIAAIYESAFYDEICHEEYTDGTANFDNCINKTSKIITISVKIISIILEIYFVHVTRKFANLVQFLFLCPLLCLFSILLYILRVSAP